MAAQKLPVKSKSRKCTVEGCERIHNSRGYCRKHYLRWKAHRDPLTVLQAPFGDALNFLNNAVDFKGAECLMWPFHKGRRGYGRVTINGVLLIASREICKMAHGEPPTTSHQAAHSCGNPACINPAHISWKTPKENQADRIGHGTNPLGENNPNCKLTETKVREIRKDTRPRKDIADSHNVSIHTISAIRNRRIWSHID